MTHVVGFVCLGSLGDVAPILSLALELAELKPASAAAAAQAPPRCRCVVFTHGDVCTRLSRRHAIPIAATESAAAAAHKLGGFADEEGRDGGAGAAGASSPVTLWPIALPVLFGGGDASAEAADDDGAAAAAATPDAATATVAPRAATAEEAAADAARPRRDAEAAAAAEAEVAARVEAMVEARDRRRARHRGAVTRRDEAART